MARQRNKRKRAIRHPRRRGIVLLIIISVLVLFMLMLVTFAVVSGHYRDAARSFAYRRAAATLDTKVELDSVMTQLISDAESPNSALWGHSFFADLYGDSIRGTLTANATSEASGTFCSFNATRATVQPFSSAQFKNVEGYYAGCVLTMIDGPCAGLSTRVMVYYPGNRPPPASPNSLDDSYTPGDVNDPVSIRVEAFENGQVPQSGNSFVLNGKPFNGTGVGQNPTTLAYGNDYVGDTMNDADATNDVEWALVPHLAAWKNRTNAKSALSGGADEPWDAFDYQNMFLTAVQVDASGTPTAIYPAFHRPDLVNYWEKRLNALSTPQSIVDPAHAGYNRDLARQVIFRPLGNHTNSDHPSFNGGNATFSPLPTTFTATTWDVDNDGDGIADSIWIDPGLPVATAPDGRKYKRLVALMVRDLDSRIQVNAHGHAEFAKMSGTDYAQPGTTVSGALAGQAYNAGVNVPRGNGYGPAEVNFLNVFGGSEPAYRRLLLGTDATNYPGLEPLPGRYGFDNSVTDHRNRRPGLPGGYLGALSNDQLSVLKTQGYGEMYASNVFSSFASPPDVWGRHAIALDYTGQPVTFGMGSAIDWLENDSNMMDPNRFNDNTFETVDSPYEINLLAPSASSDTPYTVAELERVLRGNDPDSLALPSRLSNALSGATRPSHLFTTQASHIPAPRGAVPRYMRVDEFTLADYGDPILPLTPIDPINNPSGPYKSQIEPSPLSVARARIKKDYVDINGSAPAESVKQAILKQTMPFELFKGQMFDLNRPFGNGIDDDGNGVVDEPGEIQPADGIDNNGNGMTDEAGEMNKERIWTAGAYTTMYGNPLNEAKQNWWEAPGAMPYNQPNYLDFLDLDPHLYARQLYARNLYCMLRLLCDPEYFGQFSEDSLNDGADSAGNPDMGVEDTLQKRKLYFRRLAQYAINVVDSRDPDAIMTPFEYDENPFDGWHVDGNLLSDENTWLTNPDRGVVWGMEAPDLLLTETKATHNKRLRDTSYDDGDRKTTASPAPPDDYDQIGLPEGSLFIELYCPRNRVANNFKLPAELYNLNSGRLDVGRTVGNRPVWQLAISKYLDKTDPGMSGMNDPSPNNRLDNNDPDNWRPDTFSLEPYSGTIDTTTSPPIPAPVQINVFDTADTIAVERLVWFNSAPDLPAGFADVTYNNSLGWDVSVEPGQYLVVGPRANTVFGSEENGDTATYEFRPSKQRIILQPLTGAANAPRPNRTESGVLIYDTDDNLTSLIAGDHTAPVNSMVPSARIRSVVGMIADMKPPAGNTIDGNPTTWPQPPAMMPRDPSIRYVGVSVTEPLPVTDKYYTFPTNGDFYDDLAAAVKNNTLPDDPFDYRTDMPLDTPGVTDQQMFKTGTYDDRHVVILQRLANPLQPYHATLNPYINLDWASTDITVFNGDDRPDADTLDGPLVPADVQFASRQRGNHPARLGEFWNPQTVAPGAVPQASPMTSTYFNFNLKHTIGYVNEQIATPIPADPAAPAPAAIPNYIGEPNVPLPWLTWNNRPFANPMELLNVPTSSPQGVAYEFRFNRSQANADPYPKRAAGSDPNVDYEGHFKHLLPFFMSRNHASGAPEGTDYHRLFDYVETPSPYLGTERWYRPDQIDTESVGAGYRAPFNKLSRFRDPGRININTMTDPLVWDALVATYPDFQTAFGGKWNDVISSRRGGDMAANIFALPTSTAPVLPHPTIMANPFRPADAADLMPSPANLQSSMQLDRPVDATLLRSQPGDPTKPLLEITHTAPTDAYRATDRNAYFRYQPYTKLANMLTTNSNTFAVWETIGYFEVEPNPSGVDIAHPDGYRLKEELRFEDGGVRRPRAFYIIDRSIPAAFEPGQAHNVERCILQRRYLEY